MTNYKILTVTPFFPPDIGGLPDMVLNLNINLAKQGHDVRIIAPKHFGDKITRPKGYSYEVIRINLIYLAGWPYHTLRNVGFPIDFGSRIKSIMRKGNFDIVHVHDGHYPISWFAIQSAHKLRIPCVLTLHGMYALNPKVMEGKTRLEDYFNKLIYSKFLKKTQGAIGLTNQITNHAKLLGKNEIKYFTVPNGANTSIYKDNLKRKKEYREYYQLDPESIVILFRGRFEHVKGILEFSNAVKNIMGNKKIEVVIVGVGSLENKVKSILKGVARIHILPWQPVQDIHKLYIASNIFVIPSKFEGLPLVILEAMNAGLHIVYTAVGGIPDFIEGYPRKTLLKDGSSKEIQNILTETLSEYSSTKDMDESLDYARKFDWYNLALEYTKVYTQCINEKN